MATISPPTSADARISPRQLDRVLAGAPVPPDWLTPSGERGAAAIGGILHNKKRVLESGIVYQPGRHPEPAGGRARSKCR